MTIARMRKSYTNLFLLLAVLVALLSMILSHKLVKKLTEEEQNKIQIWAMATESMVSDKDVDLSIVLKILQSNNSIPVILYDIGTGEMLSHNIKLPGDNVESFLLKKTAKFGRQNTPIPLKEINQLLYYDDSNTLKQLQVFPYVQFLIIALFITLAFYAMARSKRAEQDRIWVGLSKETAHQLGTPISSLMAWVEYLKLKELDNDLVLEIGKDVDRLQIISDRFSKIGADAELKPIDLNNVLSNYINYIKPRVSKDVEINMYPSEQPSIVLLNESLFNWVIENIVKNGVDAIRGKGIITLSVSGNERYVYLDISDSGLGIEASKHKSIFSPGYTTKERGWGLGLSLVKRIVEVNHKGKIFVKSSEVSKGTTFRIELNRN